MTMVAKVLQLETEKRKFIAMKKGFSAKRRIR